MNVQRTDVHRERWGSGRSSRLGRRRFVATAVCGQLLGGCTAISPPLMTHGGGAPGRVSQRDIALSGGATIPTQTPEAVVGGPQFSYGIRDWAAIEAGGSLNGDWGAGWVGPRFTYAPRRYAKNYFAGDFNLGVGAGAIRRCGVRRDCNTLPTGGGALGLGAGGHFSFFAVYGRTRLQVTDGKALYRTLWWETAGGVQFRVAGRVDLYTQGGLAGWAADGRRAHFWVNEVGVAIRFATLGG